MPVLNLHGIKSHTISYKIKEKMCLGDFFMAVNAFFRKSLQVIPMEISKGGGDPSIASPLDQSLFGERVGRLIKIVSFF